MEPVVPGELIESKILLIRSKNVLLDYDLAGLYEVETKYLTRQVRRHQDRFPVDFCFILTRQEVTNLKCQIGTSSGWGGRRKLPMAFTEQGVAMLSGVLNSPKAIAVNIIIMRTFVQLRQIMIANKELAAKLVELEKKYDARFQIVFDAIRALMKPEIRPPRLIGFREDQKEK